MATKPASPDLIRRAELARLAATVSGNSTATPVDPERIASDAGIPFRYAPFPEEFDGILLCEAGRFFIVCNERRAPRGTPRARFTFAHELGHYFIPEHREALASGAWPAHFSLAEFAAEQPIEREADIFAANLLLPESLVRKSASGHKALELIRHLAATFETSLTATAYRAVDLDLFPAPCAALRWDALGQPAGRWTSPKTFARDREFFGLVAVPPPDSVTAQAIHDLRVGEETATVDAMDWFPKLSGYGAGHQGTLVEEVMSLGHYGWLTLLHGEAAAPLG